MTGFSIDDLDRTDISDDYKVAMAECVIQWARLEGHLRALLTALEDRPLDQGALHYKRLSPDEAWRKIKSSLRSKGAAEPVLSAVQENREASRAFYETRKHIVHSGLVGRRKSDTDYLAFAPFESDQPGQMVFVWIPIQDIIRSGSFARAAGELAHGILRQLGH